MVRVSEETKPQEEIEFQTPRQTFKRQRTVDLPRKNFREGR